MTTYRGNLRRGFTIIEIMITLAIVVILAGLGYITMAGYLPKQRLITTARYLETILQRAQSEAYSRATQVGVRLQFVNGRFVARVFLDADSSETQDVAEGTLTEILFRDGVVPLGNTVSPCLTLYAGAATNCNCIATSCDCYIIFDTSGQAVDPANTANPVDYEIFIHSQNLEPGAGGVADREIEVLSSGLVEVIRQGQVGNASGGRCVAGCGTQCFSTMP